MKRTINYTALILIVSAGSAAIASQETGNNAPPTPIDTTQIISQENASEIKLDEDNMADMLNARQQLQQTYTFTRTIDGKVVDTSKEVITYDDDDPIQSTEAEQTKLDTLRAAFDAKTLTRTEAFEEAKLDFILADLDRDDKLTKEEYTKLVYSWINEDKNNDNVDVPTSTRQAQYNAFMDELDKESALATANARIEEMFTFPAGANQFLNKQDYALGYLLEFDKTDLDKSQALDGAELIKFRSLIRSATPTN